MSVGGKSAQEQASALLQLGQAMQSGVVQGDEFRSLAENAPQMVSLPMTPSKTNAVADCLSANCETMSKDLADFLPVV